MPAGNRLREPIICDFLGATEFENSRWGKGAFTEAQSPLAGQRKGKETKNG
jgi:hypothetical protein